MGSGKISRDIVKDKIKKITTHDYSKIVSDNYLESQKHKDMITE